MRYAGCGLAVLLAIVLLIAIYSQSKQEAPLTNVPIEAPTGEFIGSAACQSCHADQHGSWHDSYHRTMTQLATETSVLGDFNDVRLAGKDLDVRLFKEKGKFVVEMKQRNPESTNLYSVVMTTGSHNRQAYWLSDPNDSQLKILPYMYLRAEQRWVPRHAAYISTMWQRDRPEISQFEAERGRWAAVCIRCHTTQGAPEPLDEAGVPATSPRVAEFGISCEACHGPGAAHARAKQQDSPDLRAMINPARLAHDRSSQVCGQCHSVFFHRNQESHDKWVERGYSFRPGDDLFADPVRFIGRGRADLMPQRPTHIADPAESGSFWSDGMIRVTGREFNGLIESPCYQRGEMSCLSCHEMHQKGTDTRSRAEWTAGQLKPGMDGDRACIQCHERFKDATRVAQHTHHAADSSGSTCYNCHMPHTTYGLLKATRSHQVSSPSVAVSVQTGRPNACNQCHQDQTLAWAGEKLTSWFKQPKPKLNADEERIAASVLWALRGDAGQRAITAWSFGWPEAHRASGNHWQAAFLGQLLDDPYDGVRFVAHKALKRLPGFGEFPYDFVGPPASRAAASQRARQVWESGVKRPFTAATLLDSNGRVVDLDFQRLLKLRDDRPVDISE